MEAGAEVVSTAAEAVAAFTVAGISAGRLVGVVVNLTAVAAGSLTVAVLAGNLTVMGSLRMAAEGDNRLMEVVVDSRPTAAVTTITTTDIMMTTITTTMTIITTTMAGMSIHWLSA